MEKPFALIVSMSDDTCSADLQEPSEVYGVYVMAHGFPSKETKSVSTDESGESVDTGSGEVVTGHARFGIHWELGAARAAETRKAKAADRQTVDFIVTVRFRVCRTGLLNYYAM